MADAWPNSLPQNLESDGFSEELGDNTIRSTMEVGLDKVRKRYTKSVDKVTGQMKLDATQYATLKNFYKTTLNSGTLPFTFLDPITQESNDYRFLSTPKSRSIGGNYFLVTMSWEKLP